MSRRTRRGGAGTPGRGMRAACTVPRTGRTGANGPARQGSDAARRALFAALAVLTCVDATAGDERTQACTPSDVSDALFAAASLDCDVNRDGAVTAADLSAAAAAVPATPTATATPSSTPTPTPTPTSTGTPTPTLPPPCPAAGAAVRFEIDNRSGTCELALRLSGTRVGNECGAGSLSTDYAVDVSCSGCGVVTCGERGSLAPGTWRHSIRVDAPGTRQIQHAPGLLVAGSEPETIRFTAFASVLTVDSTSNAASGSLRSHLQAAASMPKPLLIRFDDDVFPAGTPTAIELDFQLPSLAADGVTLDGTDATGAGGHRIVDAAGRPIAALSITGAHNHVVGMRFRNAGGNDRDVLNIAGAGADGNVIERTWVETAASADGIGVDNGAGADFGASVNIVRECTVSGAADKGIKATLGAHVRVERSRVHDNDSGGVQATLGGHAQVWHSLVERNGGTGAQNGLAANSLDRAAPEGEAELRVCGSMARRNRGDGVSVRGASFADVRDSYLADNGAAGLRVFNDVGDGALAAVAGTAAVCNGADGAVVADQSWADFGAGPFASPGQNAFTQNNLPGGAANLRNVSAFLVSAVRNQWENCGTGSTCDIREIAARDLSDGGDSTFFIPAQAHRALPTPVVHAIVPNKGRAGELLRIFGSGFNAIDGHFSEDNCADVEGRNRCVPLRGNCVRIGGVPAAVQAVTPTMIVARWPFTCVEPLPLVVSVDQGPTAGVSVPFTVCTQTSSSPDPCSPGPAAGP